MIKVCELSSCSWYLCSDCHLLAAGANCLVPLRVYCTFTNDAKSVCWCSVWLYGGIGVFRWADVCVTCRWHDLSLLPMITFMSRWCQVTLFWWICRQVGEEISSTDWMLVMSGYVEEQRLNRTVVLNLFGPWPPYLASHPPMAPKSFDKKRRASPAGAANDLEADCYG